MPLGLRGSTSVDCLLGPANTSVALSVARSNCANPPHKLRKSLSQIAQTNPLNCANQRASRVIATTAKARRHKGLWRLCGPSGAKTKPKRIATWSANETQRNTNGYSQSEYPNHGLCRRVWSLARGSTIDRPFALNQRFTFAWSKIRQSPKYARWQWAKSTPAHGD